jgi:hypothetical protein
VRSETARLPTALGPAGDAVDVGAFTIDNVYPWGRTFDEYRRMFNLTPVDLTSRILSAADGPAGFNTEVTRRGGRVLSCDPLYRFTADQIRARVEATRGVMLDLVRREAHRFVWTYVHTPEHLAELRLSAMEQFLADYEQGRTDGRYVARSLPRLGLTDDAFDLALCSHFLFLYSDEFPASFHVDAVLQLARVAADVRVFPLLNLRGEPSPHVEPVIQSLRARGLDARRERVDYEFQRGGNEMLRVTR